MLVNPRSMAVLTQAVSFLLNLWRSRNGTGVIHQCLQSTAFSKVLERVKRSLQAQQQCQQTFHRPQDIVAHHIWIEKRRSFSRVGGSSTGTCASDTSQCISEVSPDAKIRGLG
jgi:hypothetical protein